MKKQSVLPPDMWRLVHPPVESGCGSVYRCFFNLRLIQCSESTWPTLIVIRRWSRCFTEKRAEGEINQMAPVLAQLVTGTDWVRRALLVRAGMPTPSYFMASSRGTVQNQWNDRLLWSMYTGILSQHLWLSDPKKMAVGDVKEAGLGWRIWSESIVHSPVSMWLLSRQQGCNEKGMLCGLWKTQVVLVCIGHRKSWNMWKEGRWIVVCPAM